MCNKTLPIKKIELTSFCNVIHAICKSAGVAVQGSMSRHTVSRAILEGGIAAKIQICHELAQAEGKWLPIQSISVQF